jgi:hypothetical protein
MLFLSEGQAGEAWEPSNKAMLSSFQPKVSHFSLTFAFYSALLLRITYLVLGGLIKTESHIHFRVNVGFFFIIGCEVDITTMVRRLFRHRIKYGVMKFQFF